MYEKLGIMPMFVLSSIGMRVFMHDTDVMVHMFMNQVRSQKQVVVAEYLFGTFIHHNLVIFAHDYGSGADLLNNIKIVRGSVYNLAFAC
jgi:hypothetical protein